MRNEREQSHQEKTIKPIRKPLAMVAGAALVAVAVFAASPQDVSAGGGCGPYDGMDEYGQIVHCNYIVNSGPSTKDTLVKLGEVILIVTLAGAGVGKITGEVRNRLSL